MATAPSTTLSSISFAGDRTTPQVLAEVGYGNASKLGTDLLNAIKDLQDEAEDATAFVEGLQDPTQRDFWGNNVVDNTLSKLSNIVVPFPATISPNVLNTTATPPDLLTDAINIPLVDVAPTYAREDIGIVWDEAAWDTELLDAVQLELLRDLATGGYGIEVDDETALWQRAREREQIEGEALIQDVTRQAASRGMMLPPGVLYKQIQAAQQAAAAKNSSVSRDIAMKRADLYVQNRQFTIEKAIDTERALLDYTNAYYNRKLEAMKANLESYRISVEVYDARIKAYMANLDAQQTEVRMQVEVMDAKVKLNLATVSKYETMLRVEIQKVALSVDNFRAQTADASARVDMAYKSGALLVSSAEAKLRQTQSQIQNTAELNKLKLGAMEQAAKLYIEPATALTTLAQAYLGTTSGLSLGST